MKPTLNTLRVTVKAAALVALTMFPLAAKPAPKEQTPHAVALLHEAVDTLSTLHPARIHMAGVLQPKGDSTKRFVWDAVRNDATHSLIRITFADGSDNGNGEFYKNGTQRVFYDRDKKTYENNSQHASDADDIAKLVGIVFDSLFAGMSVADIRHHSHMANITARGIPLTRVTLYNPMQPDPNEANRVDAVIGRDDHLLRQLTVDSPNTGRGTFTITYERPKTPYPASTFVFVPPPGTKEAAKDE